MHQYAMRLVQSDFKYTQENYSYEIQNSNDFQYKLATKVDDFYKKAFPTGKKGRFLLVKVKAAMVDNELQNLKFFVITAQVLILLFFLFISFILAKLSLKPVNDTISHLDRFLKDLIHDLNTPATSILLNTKLLEKSIDDKKSIKQLNRIKNSAKSISSLYENLEVLIDKNLKKESIDLYEILEEKKENYTLQYPHIKINLPQQKMEVFTNKKSIIRIIDNILSNSCKYANNNGPKIDIEFFKNQLIIKDNGKGIKYPKKVFERSYSEDENGHGIGMHIVYRLCNELGIDIDIDSQKDISTKVVLKF